MRWSALTILAACALAAPSVFAVGLESIQEKQDPLHPGLTASVSLDEGLAGSYSTTASQAQVELASDDGIGVRLTLPFVLAESTPALAGATTPRLGGGIFQRAFLESLFRFWGDYDQYLALDLSVGFPFQSSTAFQNSPYNSWFLGGSFNGRVDWGFLAMDLSLEDGSGQPNVLASGSSVYYLDVTNIVYGLARFDFYPSKWLSPHFFYEQVFPVSASVGTDQADSTFIVSTAHVPRTTILSFGVDLSPKWVPTLLSFDCAYFAQTSGPLDGGFQFSWTGKWIF